MKYLYENTTSIMDKRDLTLVRNAQRQVVSMCFACIGRCR